MLERTMRTLLLIAIILLQCSSSNAQNEEWQWLKCFGGTGADETKCADIDNKGNIFIGGFFQKKIKFGKFELNSRGEFDGFVAKLKPNGKVLWAKNIGGDYSEGQTITDFVAKLFIDSQGNIIIAGEFYVNAYFENHMVKAAGTMDTFLAMLNTDGELVWIRNLGGMYHLNFYDMVLDPDDNIYIAHSIIEKEGIQSYRSYSVLTSYNNKGDILWTKKMENHQNALLSYIDNAVCYIANVTSNDSINDRGLFINYYDTNGNEISSFFYKTSEREIIKSVNSTNDNSLLLTGNLLLLKDEKNEVPPGSGLVNYGKFHKDGTCQWLIDPSLITLSWRQKLIQIDSQHYLLSNIFHKTVDILDKAIYPTGNWYNSYILLFDDEGNLQKLFSSMEGIINTVGLSKEQDLIITGSFLSSTQLLDRNYNKEKGFLDIYIGKKALK